jgi:hypothetical protein
VRVWVADKLYTLADWCHCHVLVIDWNPRKWEIRFIAEEEERNDERNRVIRHGR